MKRSAQGASFEAHSFALGKVSKISITLGFIKSVVLKTDLSHTIEPGAKNEMIAYSLLKTQSED